MTDKDKKAEIEGVIEKIGRLKEKARADRAEYICSIIEKIDPGKDTVITYRKTDGAVRIERKTGVYIGNAIGRQVLIGECNFFNRTGDYPGIVFFTGYDEDGDFGEYLYCSTTVFVFETAMPEHAIIAAIKRLERAEKEFYQSSDFVRNCDVYNSEVLDSWELF